MSKCHLSENLLSCDLYNSFWISWATIDAYEIRIGRGAVTGQNIIMTYTNPDKFHINGFSVASQEITSSDWQFGTYAGNVISE